MKGGFLMSTVVLYYSFSGATKKLAAELAAQAGGQAYEITEPRKRSKLAAYTLGCIQALRGATPSIDPIRMDLGAFDTIILAAPVWAGRPAPAINSVADQLPAGKRVEIVLTSMSGNGNAEGLAQKVRARQCEVISTRNVRQ